MHTNNHSSSTMDGATVIELFFALIQCGIGKRKDLPRTPNAQEWSELFDIVQKQTLPGIAFAGIEVLPQEQRPTKEILLNLYKMSTQIKSYNASLDKKCALVSEEFRKEGFRNCILKGQGIARLYPNPALRTPGDIDIWLDGGDEKAIEYVKRFFPECEPTYHHVDFPIADGLDIEIHYRPTWLYNPFTNRRLQRFFEENAATQFNNDIRTAEGCFPAPTVAFNRVYILLHIYRHVFFEGIGMRQLLDYYFVLQQGMSANEKSEYIVLLKRFGLMKFAKGVMYVLQRMFGLDEEHTPVEPNKRHGEFLLREIMIAGNFGKYDHRYNLGQQGYSLKRVIETMRRTMTLATRYPGETLWSPWFKVWHYFWRRRH